MGDWSIGFLILGDGSNLGGGEIFFMGQGGGGWVGRWRGGVIGVGFIFILFLGGLLVI